MIQRQIFTSLSYITFVKTNVIQISVYKIGHPYFGVFNWTNMELILFSFFPKRVFSIQYYVLKVAERKIYNQSIFFWNLRIRIFAERIVQQILKYICTMYLLSPLRSCMLTVKNLVSWELEEFLMGSCFEWIHYLPLQTTIH